MGPDWTDAPYVACDRCERDTRYEGLVRVGIELECEHCKATLRIIAVQDIQRTRTTVVRLPPGITFDDEETPVETPQECPSCGAKSVIFATVAGRARCPQCPKEAA